MSKYAPLSDTLRVSGKDTITITFSEIEKILNADLPPTARKKPEWWSNNATGHSQAAAWLTAGFNTEKIDLEGETLVFRRQKRARAADNRSGGKSPRRHPIFGCMKGTVTVAEGVDLTEPADPNWGMPQIPK